MEKFKRLSRLTLRSFFVILLVVALALPLGFSAYADTGTIEIDGVLYDQIDITSEELASIVNGGSSNSQWVFTTTSYSGYTFGDLFNLENHTKGQFHVSSNFPYALPKNKIFAIVNGDDVFICLPYVYHANRIDSEDLTASFGITLPFDAYFYSSTISYSFSSVYTQTSSTFISVYDGVSTFSSTSTLNTQTPTPYWNTIPLFTDFYNKYNWRFDGYTLSNLRTAYFTNTLTTPSSLRRFSSFTIDNITNVPMHAGSYSHGQTEIDIQAPESEDVEPHSDGL